LNPITSLTGILDPVVAEIIANRPYTDRLDFETKMVAKLWGAVPGPGTVIMDENAMNDFLDNANYLNPSADSLNPPGTTYGGAGGVYQYDFKGNGGPDGTAGNNCVSVEFVFFSQEFEVYAEGAPLYRYKDIWKPGRSSKRLWAIVERPLNLGTDPLGPAGNGTASPDAGKPIRVAQFRWLN
jgi:hypothetical protein